MGLLETHRIGINSSQSVSGLEWNVPLLSSQKQLFASPNLKQTNKQKQNGRRREKVCVVCKAPGRGLWGHSLRYCSAPASVSCRGSSCSVLRHRRDLSHYRIWFSPFFKGSKESCGEFFIAEVRKDSETKWKFLGLLKYGFSQFHLPMSVPVCRYALYSGWQIIRQ